MPWLQLASLPELPLPGPDWVRIEPVLAGICGTDMALLTGRATAAMSPFSSFPAVLGHEVVGRIVEAGPGVEGIGPGDRVVVDPVISCVVRGLEPCPQCRGGHAATCLRMADGPISPGFLVGYCRDLPGGWGDGMLAHASQLYPGPDGLSDEVAVLVEPLSVALHAVLGEPPASDADVLVLGGGSIGLLTLAALRLLRTGARVSVLARHDRQAQMAERLGADRVVRNEADAAAVVGARPFRTLEAGTVYTGGFDVIYDCVGNRASLDLAFRLAAPQARVITLGGPLRIETLDWTPTWVRELRVVGAYVYGAEPSLDGRPHTLAVALRQHAEQPELPVGELVTHRFALERWREAMRVNLNRASAGALKTVFDVRERRA
jgi:L-iditol 2-dehydrogenase